MVDKDVKSTNDTTQIACYKIPPLYLKVFNEKRINQKTNINLNLMSLISF